MRVMAKIQLSPSAIMSGREYSGTASMPAGSWAVRPTRRWPHQPSSFSSISIRKISPGFRGCLLKHSPLAKLSTRVAWVPV